MPDSFNKPFPENTGRDADREQVGALVQSLIDRHKFDEALQIMQSLSERKPDDPETAHSFGVCLALANQVQESLRQFQKAVDLAPNIFLFRISLIKALFLSGSTQEASRQANLAFGLCNGNEKHEMQELIKTLGLTINQQEETSSSEIDQNGNSRYRQTSQKQMPALYESGWKEIEDIILNGFNTYFNKPELRKIADTDGLSAWTPLLAWYIQVFSQHLNQERQA